MTASNSDAATTPTPTQPCTSGIHHLGLTVPDVAASRFFVDALGFQKVAERPEYPAIFVSDGSVMLTLWQAEEPQRAVPFDRRKNIGLHHFALRVADAGALAATHSRAHTRGWPSLVVPCSAQPKRARVSPGTHYAKPIRCAN